MGIDREPALRGSIELDGSDLRLETHSEARLSRLRRLVEDAAGAWVEHRADTVEDPSRLLERAAERPRTERRPADLPLEVQEEIMEEYMSRHYRSWLDEALPILGGETPRGAVQSQTGRAQVLDLIKDIENQTDRARRDGRPTWDPSWLREELGLAEP